MTAEPIADEVSNKLGAALLRAGAADTLEKGLAREVLAELVAPLALASIALELRELRRSGRQALPRCVSATGGHRWGEPVAGGVQVCRTCAIVRPIIEPPTGVAEEYFDLDRLGDVFGPAYSNPEKGAGRSDGL